MHRQHATDLTTPPTRAERRAQAAYDVALCIFIGTGMAGALVFWLTK